MRDFEEKNPDRSPTKSKPPVKEPSRAQPQVLGNTKPKGPTSTERASHGVSKGTVTDGEAG